MTEADHGYSRQGLERAILGADPELTAADLAQRVGLEDSEVRRLWRALGLADAGDQVGFTPGDADAFELIRSLSATGALDDETAVRVLRAVGQTTSRLADWEVATLTGRVEELEAGETATGSRLGSALRLLEEVNPDFERLLVLVWRRHLAAAVARVEALGAGEADLHTAELSVGFADLVQFSAYSNQHTQDQIGTVVELFETRAADAVALRGGRVIKTLGDSVLYVASTPVAAYDVAADIVQQVGRDKSMPDVRVGLATGPLILRLGDVFGPAVNLAARMTSVARRNRVICDQRTAELLPVPEFQLRALPLRPLRGFGDVEPIAVKRASL